MAGLIPITASVASSFQEGFTGLSGTSNPFDNSGSGITFGNAVIGPSTLTSAPGQNQTPTLTNPSTAALGNAASGIPLSSSSGVSSPLTLILIVAAGGIVVWLVLKK